ncbi:tryptophan--tRNA ligase [Patulibacter brassicae]|uniref:Tryptophan--tRNA ligase n=1 Tax=Patulibacter brassicae TaxID=1705717 RepID=A0ABU4VQR3_9ACTN|nr:tryptophan--tRNA ligase [Patulibacter brassicae]MDX8153707.1 tryptophan--tRNA ligase [Patulibacter brassicae]
MRVYSGIQPTGRKHLGNYLGAIRHYVTGQEEARAAGDEAIFCVVDLHATTVAYDPAELRDRTYDTVAILLAAGLDPAASILYRQGDVPEVPELTWLLTSVTAHGDLNRMHQFKEKSAQQRELVSAGLFLYPVLMAADVLAFRADRVPVGDDQRQHIELMRDIALRFNARFGGGDDGEPREILRVPEGVYPTVAARIMDLQAPERKMSTSSGSIEGTLYLLDDARTTEKKLKRAVTDSENPPRIVRGPEKAGVSNLIDILAATTDRTPDEVEASLTDARGYGDLKVAAADAVNATLAPLRERYAELRGDEAAIEAALAVGAEKARAIAQPVLAEVREAMGVGPRA